MCNAKQLTGLMFFAISLIQLTGCVPYSDFERKKELLDWTTQKLESVEKQRDELQKTVAQLQSKILVIDQIQVNEALWVMECSRLRLTNSLFTPCNFSQQDELAARQLLAKPVVQSWGTKLYQLGLFWLLFVLILLPPLTIVVCSMVVFACYLGESFAPAFLYENFVNYRNEVDTRWQMQVEAQEIRQSELERKHQLNIEKLCEKDKISQKLIRSHKLEISDLEAQISYLTEHKDDLFSEYQKAYSDFEMLNSKLETLKEDVSAQVNLLAKDEILRRAKTFQDLQLVDLKLGKS
jgi:hypothetical protein